MKKIVSNLHASSQVRSVFFGPGLPKITAGLGCLPTAALLVFTLETVSALGEGSLNIRYIAAEFKLQAFRHSFQDLVLKTNNELIVLIFRKNYVVETIAAVYPALDRFHFLINLNLKKDCHF